MVGGLTGVPLVAVPTSVGYGASFGGLAALLAMLNSCAPGVVGVQHRQRLRRRRLRGPGGPARRPCGPGAGVTLAWLDGSAGAQRRHAARRAGRRRRRLTVHAGRGRRARRRAGAAGRRAGDPGRAGRDQGRRRGRRASDVRRTWPDVRALLEAADLAEPVRDRALDVFARLARAEAAAHGIDPDAGALPRGRRAGRARRRRRRLRRAARPRRRPTCTARRSPSGSGRCGPSTACSRCPVPAVLALLAEVGAPVGAGDVDGETCTPTGAALLARVGHGWGAAAGDAGAAPPAPAPAAATPPGRPNVLRVVLGEPASVGAATERRASSSRRNVDDLDPRVWPGVLAALLAAGASDAWLTPILMKKGRPAHTAVGARRRRTPSTPSAGWCSPRARRSACASTAWPSTPWTARRAPSTSTGAAVRVKVARLDGRRRQRVAGVRRRRRRRRRARRVR